MRTLRIDTPFAVFSDVHGNLPGLEAILADIERRKVPATISLGDLVGYGPSPNEVALLVRDRGIPSLMGNYDQGIGFETGDCGCVYKTDEQRAEGAASLAWTQEAVTDEVKAYLRTLDDHFDARHAGRRRCSPCTAARGASTSTSSRTGRRRPWRAWPTSIPYPAILFGHTHVPYARPVGETIFVNVGSGGRPKDGDWRVCYAIVDPAKLGVRRLRRVRARALRLRAPAARPGRDAADHELRGTASAGGVET